MVRFKNKLPSESMTDLVWLQTAFLGDVILTTAAMALARRQFPHVRQHVITNSIGAQVLAGEDLAGIYIFEKRGGNFFTHAHAVKQSLRANLGKGSVPMIIQAHRSARSSFLARYLGMPTVTYHETAFAWLASERRSRIACLHEAVRIALLLESLGVTREAIVDARPVLQPAAQASADFPASAMTRLSQPPWIGVAAGSVWGTKRWPIESYGELLSSLLYEHPQSQIVLLGSPGEIEHIRPLKERFRGEARVLDLVGKTKIADLLWLYPKLNLLISNDSSPTHFASAYQIPAVTIFGATTSGLGFGPLSEGSRVVELPNLACRPCSDHGPQQCPLGHFRCMRDLSVRQVRLAVQSSLVPKMRSPASPSPGTI